MLLYKKDLGRCNHTTHDFFNKMLFKNSLIRIIREYSIDIYPRFVRGRMYKMALGKDVNCNKPRDINEKIQWLICYSDTSRWVDLTDKVKVRDYVRSKGYGENLIKLYGTWDNAEDIEFDELPNRFVLKCNHDCGSFLIIDKIKGYDRTKVVKHFNECLKNKYGYKYGEKHYNKIIPCVLAEEYLEQTDLSISNSLIDFKIWCFQGKPHSIHVYFNRVKDSYQTNVYDLEWNLRSDCSIFNNKHRDGKGIVQRPKNLEKMLLIASDLSIGFPEVRVDFYDINGKIYFSEMTFTSHIGQMDSYSQNYLNELGDLCVLPQKKSLI